MIERASQERVAPILMTAFAGIGLILLVLADEHEELYDGGHSLRHWLNDDATQRCPYW